jgi:hypothetical protein
MNQGEGTPTCGEKHPERSYGGKAYICDLPQGHDGDHTANTPALAITWPAAVQGEANDE